MILNSLSDFLLTTPTRFIGVEIRATPNLDTIAVVTI